jgi:phosphoenolpyruvate carboxykinase (GTP)
MAMLPFCGYHMGDYFAHWLKIGKAASPEKLPKIYYVNWFRQDENRKFLWPGYGENSRVLKWVFDRIEGKAEAVDTPIGRLPGPGALDISGLDLAPGALDELLKVHVKNWLEEIPLIREHFDKLGDRLPEEMRRQTDQLEDRLKKTL